MKVIYLKEQNADDLELAINTEVVGRVVTIYPTGSGLVAWLEVEEGEDK